MRDLGHVFFREALVENVRRDPHGGGLVLIFFVFVKFKILGCIAIPKVVAVEDSRVLLFAHAVKVVGGLCLVPLFFNRVKGKLGASAAVFPVVTAETDDFCAAAGHVVVRGILFLGLMLADLNLALDGRLAVFCDRRG